MGKQYSSVIDMVRSISDDKEFKSKVDREINSRKISRYLGKMRNMQNLSVADIGKRMNVTTRKVVKIENTYDTDFKMGDILLYTKALDMKIDMFFLNSKTMWTDRVKYHYFRLKSLVDRIVDISKGDEAMEREAETFAKEAFINISSGLLECLEKAEKHNKRNEPSLTVSAGSEKVEASQIV